MRTWLWKVWSSQPSVCCLGNMESPLLFVLCRTSAEVLYELVYLWPSGLNRFWNDFVPQMFTLDSEPECKLMSVVGDVSVPSHEFPFHLFFYCCFSICFPFYFFPMYFLFFSLLFAENRNSSVLQLWLFVIPKTVYPCLTRSSCPVWTVFRALELRVVCRFLRRILPEA